MRCDDWSSKFSNVNYSVLWVKDVYTVNAIGLFPKCFCLPTVHECLTCKKISGGSIPGGPSIVLASDFIKTVISGPKPAKQKNVENFLKLMNARLNAGGGSVCVHIDDPHCLGFFDEKVDDKMMELIADDTLFSDNFERCYQDENHVLFRVKQRQRCHLSTFNFNTKQSLDRGLSDLTHGQMRHWIAHRSTSEPAASGKNRLRFVKGEVVKDGNGVFQESVSVQAKRVPETLAEKGGEDENRIESLAEYCWEGTSKPLSHYISAFTKLRQGGSVYFGLSEEKRGEKQEMRTGRFKCDGVALDDSERKKLRRLIVQKVSQNMQSIPIPPADDSPVEVEFRQVVEGGADLFIVEVAVKYVDGVVFYARGPLSYRLSQSGKDEEITIKEWIKHYQKSASSMDQAC
ncbi:hypothetical protein BaRGS_00017607 [Batillaria attramentaria]|uniref:Schlafen AlbA-2 domain-containing protein n=1 Tax=Batillaria attramentaria TaxID=370345 RepID=A0ABD0KWK1_9CAEN